MHCATLSVGKNCMQKITTSYTINRQAAQELHSTPKKCIQESAVTEEIANYTSAGNYLIAVQYMLRTDTEYCKYVTE